MRPQQGVPTRRRFVANTLASLGPGAHTDPGCQGLQLRVREKRGGMSRTWIFRYMWRGTWVRQTFGHYPGKSLVEAREAVTHLRRLLDDGIDPRRSLPRRNAVPVALSVSAAAVGGEHIIDNVIQEFATRFLRATRKRPEYAEAILAKNVRPEWAGRDVRTIRPREVIVLLDKIVARGSTVMANRTAALLGQLFKFAIHRGLVDTTPVQLLYRPGGKERPRERTLSDKELAAFLKDPRACTRFERLEHVILILLLTGQRRGELALAKWRDVDLQAGTWKIPDENAKSGRGHVVPLSQWAVDEFKVLKRESEGSAYVMPDSPGSNASIDAKQLTRSLAKCRERFKRAGIDEFTLHDLRRTCRTGLARLKVEPHIAERVLGHAQERIRATYDTHAYLDEKRLALERWSAHLVTVMG
jgi:integrase